MDADATTDRVERVIRLNLLPLAVPWLLFCVLVGISVAVHTEEWKAQTPSTIVVEAMLVGAPVFGLIVRRQYYLRLTPDGLTIHYLLGRSRFFPWWGIKDFCINPLLARVWVFDVIAFNLYSDVPGSKITRRISKGLSGYSMTFIGPFEFSAEDVVALLIEWKTRYAPEDEESE